VSASPFTKRFRSKTSALGYYLTAKQAARIQRAFVAALKEEVEARFRAKPVGDGIPLVIAGLGSFKMRTRPARVFQGGCANEITMGSRKGPSRRLIFTAKWEPIP
jgi:hypothetical protein